MQTNPSVLRGSVSSTCRWRCGYNLIEFRRRRRGVARRGLFHERVTRPTTICRLVVDIVIKKSRHTGHIAASLSYTWRLYTVSVRGRSGPAAAAPFDLRRFRRQRLWSIRTWLIIFTARCLARAPSRATGRMCLRIMAPVTAKCAPQETKSGNAAERMSVPSSWQYDVPERSCAQKFLVALQVSVSDVPRWSWSLT